MIFKEVSNTRYSHNVAQVKFLLVNWVLIFNAVFLTMSGFNSWCQTFVLVCNQPPKANSAFHPYGVSK